MKKRKMDFMEGSRTYLNDSTKPEKETFVSEEQKSLKETAKDGFFKKAKRAVA
jgi:hypothetical protein